MEESLTEKALNAKKERYRELKEYRKWERQYHTRWITTPWMATTGFIWYKKNCRVFYARFDGYLPCDSPSCVENTRKELRKDMVEKMTTTRSLRTKKAIYLDTRLSGFKLEQDIIR